MDSNSCQVTLSEGRRVVLPATICDQFDFHIGDRLTLTVEAGDLRLQSFQHSIDAFRQELKQAVGPGRSLVDELIAEREAAAAHE